jgi:diacylglycerol O-acyltransferase
VTLVAPMDAVYLWGETDRSPSHVVALQIFRPPEDADPDLPAELHARWTDPARLKRSFRRRPRRTWSSVGQYTWVQDDDIDLALHVRRAGLPRPGRMRDLLEFVAAVHEVPLERDRPLWQAHLVEGLADGRFALCTKMHHSLFDGITMGKHLLGGLSSDPAARGTTAPWLLPPGRSERVKPDGSIGVSSVLDGLAGGAASTARSAAAVARSVPTLLGAVRDGVMQGEIPFAAPPSMFNVAVSSARRFAGDAWPKARLRDVAGRAGTSSNDVAVAMCAGALRTYLLERDALPDTSLVAMVPVSTAPRDGDGGDGNAWGAVLCDLATETTDAGERLTRIHGSMARHKTVLADLDPVSAAALSAFALGGAVLNLLPGPQPPRPPFNLIISNVPGARETLYLDGCELTDNYPVSVVVDGQALNMTMVSYGDRLAFGITGCRRSVPHLQRLLRHLEDALADLERAVGMT